ncbi:CBS domain-containing protein [Hyalangium gracile]|uniref:CBS domain-containing protein n=1 Tax=Hyalangium gracile TaxID=394092 RepID=UPI001CCAB31C|nr:CBS domain-containing protein [Hyalangium gracile]
MADRRMDNGRDDARSTQRTGVPENGTGGILAGTDVSGRGIDVTKRGADVSPPGSRERSESGVTGYSPERDEDPAVRQGRFHRAASMRLAQPRADMGMGMSANYGMSRTGPVSMDDRDDTRLRPTDWGSRSQGSSSQGPYGRDDRDDRYATGIGGGQMRMGEQDTRHSLEMRRDVGGDNYRQWDRTGYGVDERQLREDRGQYSGGQYGNQGQLGVHGQSSGQGAYGNQGPYSGGQYSGIGQSSGQYGNPGQGSGQYGSQGRYDPLLGLGHASAGQPGTGVNIGRSETYTARGSDTEHQRSGRTGLGGLFRRWQREPLTAREIMTRGVKTVRRDATLREVAQLMKDEDCGVVPIVDERGTLVGIVTDRDLVVRAFTGGKTPDQLRAMDVMTDDVECVHPEEDIHSIIELMGRKQIRRIPVVEKDDRVIGIISMGDIANRADYDEELQQALDRISSKRSFWSRLT